MQIEPLKVSHMHLFEPGEHDRAVTDAVNFHLSGWAGKAVAAVENGRTLGICGIALKDGTAHIWLALSDEMRAMPITMSRWAKRSLGHILAMDGVERAEIEVDFPGARKWAEWLGFKAIDGRRYELWR